MTAGQAGERQVERAPFVAITQLSGACDRIPAPAAWKPWCAEFVRNLSDPRADRGRVELRDQRNAGLGDARLLGRDARQALAQKLLMIEREVGDPSYERAVDDVGGVEPAAKADLEDAGVRR